MSLSSRFNQYANGPTDTFTYNGLGLRVGKTDSTGTYAYVCDGTSPGSPVLSDGQAVYTPGLSERRGGATNYYSNDALGNLWTVDGSGKTQAYYQDTTGFGLVTSTGGASASPFKFGGGNDCQTETDIGLVLMGHRYYDPRTGRFISQDPIGDGDNWYAYADNSPTNEVDPTGLFEQFINPGLVGQQWQPGWTSETGSLYDLPDGTYDTYVGNGHGGLTYGYSTVIGGFGESFMQGGMGLNMGNPGGMAIMNHTNRARNSTSDIHTVGLARTAADQQKKEKGDKTRAKHEDAKKALKTGISTRDPDGSVRRAREAAELAQLEQESFDTQSFGQKYKYGGTEGSGAAAIEGGAAEESGVTVEEVVEFFSGLLFD